MLVEQGAAAFESWFDIPAPREAMWHALNAVPPTYHTS
jgi:shikimate 5-dehydrogenase